MARLADTPPKKKLGGIHRVRDEYPAGNGGYFLSNFQIAVFV